MTVTERGSVAVEVAVIAPALVALLLLVVLAGRVSHADAQVQRAASVAARTASLYQSPDAARQAAIDAAHANLADSDFVCRQLDTNVDTTQFEPGGSVTVRVSCTASMHDVTLLGVPGARTFVSSSTEVIDRYRGGDR